MTFRYSTEVTDIDFAIGDGRKRATAVHWVTDGEPGGVELGENDLVLAIIGSLSENSGNGDHHTPARLSEGPAPMWCPRAR